MSRLHVTIREDQAPVVAGLPYAFHRAFGVMLENRQEIAKLLIRLARLDGEDMQGPVAIALARADDWAGLQLWSHSGPSRLARVIPGFGGVSQEQARLLWAAGVLIGAISK